MKKTMTVDGVLYMAVTYEKWTSERNRQAVKIAREITGVAVATMSEDKDDTIVCWVEPGFEGFVEGELIRCMGLLLRDLL